MRPPLTPIGALPQPDGSTTLRLWAPRAQRVTAIIDSRELDLARESRGYWTLHTRDAPPTTRYAFRIDGGEPRPDPASRSQPDGVHDPSEVVSLDFAWTDAAFANPSLDQHVLYELHVGTFSPSSDLDGVIERLDDLADLGVTMIELMPIAQFPGARNWGYDGVDLFAVQNSYGGIGALQRLVDAAHARNLAVCLDVVYNHLGPEGKYLAEFGPYFTDRYHTPWGHALNFDGPGSDEVRNFFIQNALYWTIDLHIDALRLDAIHAINDNAPVPFVRQLAETVHREAEARGRPVHVIAESASNDPRVIRPRELGGFGCDAQWNDDFHHALRTALTGERDGYLAPFGELDQLADGYRNGYVFTGQHSSFHDRAHGAPTDGLPDRAFVVFNQNHDQVGNRALGDRLGATTDFESLKLAAAATILSPFVPLIFMGEEFAAETPFQYFVSHTDPDLVEAVRKGRREEFASFNWRTEPPDPQSEQTFNASRPDWSASESGAHAAMRSLYQRLISLRRQLNLGSLEDRPQRRIECRPERGLITIERRLPSATCLLALNFAADPANLPLPAPPDSIRVLLDTADTEWAGPGRAEISQRAVGADIRMAPRSALITTRVNP